MEMIRSCLQTEQYVENFRLLESKTEFIVYCTGIACGALEIGLTLHSPLYIKLALRLEQK